MHVMKSYYISVKENKNSSFSKAYSQTLGAINSLLLTVKPATPRQYFADDAQYPLQSNWSFH